MNPIVKAFVEIPIPKQNNKYIIITIILHYNLRHIITPCTTTYFDIFNSYGILLSVKYI